MKIIGLQIQGHSRAKRSTSEQNRHALCPTARPVHSRNCMLVLSRDLGVCLPSHSHRGPHLLLLDGAGQGPTVRVWTRSEKKNVNLLANFLREIHFCKLISNPCHLPGSPSPPFLFEWIIFHWVSSDAWNWEHDVTGISRVHLIWRPRLLLPQTGQK